MHPHRGLEVALLTKRKPPDEPQQVFGCDKDPSDPWPLQLHMHGPWLPTNQPGHPTPDGADHYRSAWQVHTDIVPYQQYPYHAVHDTHPNDQRVLLPRGTGNCTTYSIVGANWENTSGALYFTSRMLAGGGGAWDISWTTTVVAPQWSMDLVLHIYSDKGYGVALRVFGGYLHYTDLTAGWIQLAPWPSQPQDTYTRTVEFHCLLANSWCRVHVNGTTHTLEYRDAFSTFDRVTVELVHTHGGGGGTVAGINYGRAIQVSDIAVVAAPANKHIPYPFED